MKDYKTYRFFEVLDNKGIKYRYEDKWLVVGSNLYNYVDLYGVELGFIPDYIKFNNDGYVSFQNNRLTSLPDHIEFNNNGIVSLSENRLTSLPDGIKFNNNVDMIYLYDNDLTSLPDNIDEFYDRLDSRSQKHMKEKFPDHWFFEKERFGL